ncbi:response regulator transcription factor [Paenibacillus lupini]|uniref:response regulator transcription factor n=1 Tax=Paenibacillus lupini TaxID=1450204 RepID=UPI00142083B3|nr:response regulator transcription factor [Paenibacillus lupini]NIK25521.1 two-component system response regulator YesN [Paenibacillus lupini]
MKYKVLLIDDERIILEGIASLMDWDKYGTQLAGTARNGLEALQFIETQPPDIIISDIRMPGMDGLSLVKQVKEKYPHIACIMLSGFGDFDYARQAMQHGVKHYLLKPCNENTIAEALVSVVEQLNEERHTDAFMQRMQEELKKVLPSAKEQFLKEYVTNKRYGRREWDEYGRLFGIQLENLQARLLLFQLEGPYEFDHLFAIKNIAEDILGKSIILLSTTIGSQLLILVRDQHAEAELLTILSEVRRTFFGYFRIDTTIAISDAGELADARKMYMDTLGCLNHRFYLGGGSLITVRDIQMQNEQEEQVFLFDDSQLCLAAKSGNWEETSRELDEAFRILAELRLDDLTAKSNVITLYVALFRQAEPRRMNEYLQLLARFEGLSTLQALRAFVEEAAKRICQENYELQAGRHSSIIHKMMNIVTEHLGNPALSLQWAASEILYMNADYLGKLFKKETGDKFSNYVMKTRMDKALELIEESNDVKVFELAERLGFGDNPHYFSQVFKKYTGKSPSDFKKTS